MTIQIANYQISDKSFIEGSAHVSLDPTRTDSSHAGTFSVYVKVEFDPAIHDYPTGYVNLRIDLNDSSFPGVINFKSTSIEQVNTHGKITPTAIIAGRCEIDSDQSDPLFRGCRFWILFADNNNEEQRTPPDVVSFIIYDRTGMKVTYGTGPLNDGDIVVSPSDL